MTHAVPNGGQAARLEPFVLAARQSLAAAIASPGGITLDDLAVSAVLAVLSEAYRHPGMLPATSETDTQHLAASVAEVLRSLVTRSQIAARRNVSIATVMTWIDRYGDFPEPVLGKDTRVPYYWWPDVLAYLNFRQLPRVRHVPAALDAEDRDAKILEMLHLFPDGLTTEQVAALSGEEGTGGSPTPHAVRVRYEDRLRRLEAAGVVRRGPRPAGSRRAPQPWLLVIAAAGPDDSTAAPDKPARLGFPAAAAAAAAPRQSKPSSRPATAAGRKAGARPLRA